MTQQPPPIPYETPPPPPLPMSRTCCFAITWVVLTFPIVTWLILRAVMQRDGPIGLFLWRNVWLRDVIVLAPPVVGILAAVKGITDIDRHRDRDGRGLAKAAIWIAVAGLLVGATIVKG